MSNEMLLGQFISYLLYDLRQASKLKMQGRFFEAVSIQIDAIQELYFKSKEDEERLREWEKSYDAIPEAVKDIVGTDSHETKYFKYITMNRLSKNLYREINRDVWKKLHDMGYFKMEKWKPKTKRDTMFDEQT